jgi:hypothetical protein
MKCLKSDGNTRVGIFLLKGKRYGELKINNRLHWCNTKVSSTNKHATYKL